MATRGPRPASALPPVGARVVAFAVILVMGGAGATIGGSFVSIQCRGSCSTPVGIGALTGGAAAAGGTGVIVTLTLRAMGEWRRISDEELYGDGGGDGGGDGDGDGARDGNRGDDTEPPPPPAAITRG